MSTVDTRVAILGHPDDTHMPFVTRHLSHEPVIINAGDAYSLGMSYHFDPTQLEPRVVCGDTTYDLSPIRSVWFRSVDTTRLACPDIPNDSYREYVLSSLMQMGAALPGLFDPEVFWVSRRDAVLAAQHKPNQLVRARQFGFRVPETIFTSNDRHAREFVAKVGNCVMKPLALRPPDGYAQPTRRLWPWDAKKIAGLASNPHIFQQLLRPDFELRVAVVGDQAFASVVSDRSQDQARADGIYDFRASFESETFEAEAYQLPEWIEKACVQLVHSYGTVCGFMDLAVVGREFYFFESNPNGQWAFVDEQTVDKIGRAIAHLLETRGC